MNNSFINYIVDTYNCSVYSDSGIIENSVSGSSPCINILCLIKVITKLPNSEQSYKGKVQTHNYINRQNQSTTGKL